VSNHCIGSDDLAVAVTVVLEPWYYCV